MERLDYGELVEPWKLNLIISRAKRLGLRGEDIQDIQQELVLDVMQFRYDRAKSNGATEATALTALIDNYLKKLLRSDARYRGHLDQFSRQEKRSYDPVPDEQQAIDVQDAIGALSEQERMVCHALDQGQSKSQIARTLGCGWHTVDRLIHRIRRHLEKFGLDKQGRD